jgi:hypothetical protein
MCILLAESTAKQVQSINNNKKLTCQKLKLEIEMQILKLQLENLKADKYSKTITNPTKV